MKALSTSAIQKQLLSIEFDNKSEDSVVPEVFWLAGCYLHTFSSSKSKQYDIYCQLESCPGTDYSIYTISF